jgi:hypothetical protein
MVRKFLSPRVWSANFSSLDTGHLILLLDSIVENLGHAEARKSPAVDGKVERCVG